MKTSSIRYRVADFLKQHPPFDCLDEADLLELAGSGRVRFHEGGEIVFEQGRERKPHFFVIQQGAVRLLDLSEGEEELRDLRGEGDIVGVGAFLGAGRYLYRAVSEGDTILYALSLEEFRACSVGYPEVARFLAAYFSLHTHYASDPAGGSRLGGGSLAWLDDVEGSASGNPTPSCSQRDTIREAAGRMARAGSPVIVVVDEEGRPVGWLSDEDLRARVATGELSVEAPTLELARQGVPTIAPGASVGAQLLAMLRGASEVIAVTADGSADRPLLRAVTESELRLAYGDEPLLIARTLQASKSVEELASLRDRAEALVLSGLDDRRSVGWVSEIASELNAWLARRLIALVELELAAEGLRRPELAACWMFFGSGGRGELLTRKDLHTGLVYADPSADSAAVRDYFLALARGVTEGLARCGFAFSERGVQASEAAWCQPLSAWRRRFGDWVRDPVGHRTYHFHPLFDLLPVWGDHELVDVLRNTIRSDIEANPSFVPLLANDSLANLPPLTFFRGLVVEDDGESRERLDLRRGALQPLVDIGRVFALEAGEPGGTSTIQRLAGAARRRPEQEALFRDGEEAFRIALHRRALNGLKTRTDGAQVDVSDLSKYDQHLLKGAFRSVVRLLEFTAHSFQLSPRR